MIKVKFKKDSLREYNSLYKQVRGLSYKQWTRYRKISEKEILNIAKKYKKINCEIKGSSVYITSWGCMEWFFYLADVRKGKIILYHKNKLINNKNGKPCGKHKYHIQREYYDVPYMIKQISTHDIHKLKNFVPHTIKVFEEMEQFEKIKKEEKRASKKNRNWNNTYNFKFQVANS